MEKPVWWITLILMSLLCFLSWSAYTNYTPRPYILKLEKAHDRTVLEADTYSLEKWGRSAKASSYTDPIEMVKNDKPILMKSTDYLKLSFENTPVSVRCYLWDMKTGSLAYKSLAGSVLNFSEIEILAGDYAMEIHAKWENGYGLYNTRVIVNEK